MLFDSIAEHIRNHTLSNEELKKTFFTHEEYQQLIKLALENESSGLEILLSEYVERPFTVNTLRKDISKFLNFFLENYEIMRQYINPQKVLEYILYYTTHDNYSEATQKVIDQLILWGADINPIVNSYILFFTTTQNDIAKLLEILLANGVNKWELLEKLFQLAPFRYVEHKQLNFSVPTFDLKQYQIVEIGIKYLIEEGVASLTQFSENTTFYNNTFLFYPKEFLEYLLSKGFSADKLIYEILVTNTFHEIKDGKQITYHIPEYVKVRIDLLKTFAPYSKDINKVFEFLVPNEVSCMDGEVINILFEAGASANLILFNLLQSKDSKISDQLFELFVQHGLDPNYQEEEITILEAALIKQKYEVFDKLIEIGAKNEITLMAFFCAFNEVNIETSYELISRLPRLFSEEEIYDKLRSLGASNIAIKYALNLYKLAIGLQKYKNGENLNISDKELSLLDSNLPQYSAEEYINLEMQNHYGFTALQLAIITHKFDLASDMLDAGADIMEISPIGIPTLVVLGDLLGNRGDLSFDNQKKLDILAEKVLNNVINVDLLIINGETLADSFLNIDELKDQILNKSNDILFKFFKEDADLFDISKTSSDKTHIAISHGSSFWSSGINGAARLIMKNHPEVEFHLVTQEMINEGGDVFIKQFNGWINPGAGDSFPTAFQEFSKAHWKPKMDLEEHYQYVLEKTENFQIPTLGMCAGAQNLIIYHDGYLYPLKGYNQGQHTISFKEGTLSHYQSMTAFEQSHALKTCEFPSIQFKGDTAHNFAAVSGKLGNGIELGAISEHGVPMAYSAASGIRFATQFHPEHYYGENLEDSINYQKQWLENFVFLAKMHHNFLYNNGAHPETYMTNIKSNLEKCMIEEVCVNEYHAEFFANNTLFEH